MEFDNLEASRFAINAINHSRGDPIAAVVLNSISSNLVATDRYGIISRANKVLHSERVSAAIDWTANRDQKLREAQKQGNLNG